MWIYRFVYFLFQGHAYIDINSIQRPYRYCLHCGEIMEPAAVLKNLHMKLDQAHENGG
jgi:hypothetical protein